MGGACGEKKRIKVKPKGGEHLGNLGINSRILLK
jgi:hypothetical protein